MRDKISLLPVEQHFNSHQIQTYHQRKVRQADIEFYRSQKHVR